MLNTYSHASVDILMQKNKQKHEIITKYNSWPNYNK